MTEPNDYVTVMRGMYAAARIQFCDDAEAILADADDATKAFAESLVGAIGEVSPDEALTALIKFKAEQQRKA